MRKYLELFKEGFPSDMSDRTAIENWPYVGHDINGGVVYTVIPAKEEPITWDPYVTFTAQEDNSSIGLTKLSTNQTMEYSMDTSTWNAFDKTTNISLNNGDKVYVRGVLNSDNAYNNYTQFKMSGKIAASGNCNAIWNYEDLNAPLKVWCGYYMFQGCTSLATAPELPAAELAESCYYYMFQNCTSLTVAPALPATTLADSCYNNMFKGCTSLTTVPELPAAELADSCYNSMFSDCTSITTIPKILPATMLAKSCYNGMFYNCTSLTTAPELPATTLAERCYQYMFNGCTSLTTAPELPATELTYYCYMSMFKGCTSLTTAPELPATTLAQSCYNSIFYSCTKLNHITCLATDISAYSCTNYWVFDVPSTGTFIKHPSMNSWTVGTSGIPEGWNVEDAVL